MKEDIALVGIDETKTTIRDELFDGTLRHDRDSRNKKQKTYVGDARATSVDLGAF
jgi:hypothetical protein